MTGRKRRQYLRDPTKPVPKSTEWRLRQKNEQISLPTDALTQGPSSKRLKLYLRDPSLPVPRQTLWSALMHRTRDGGGAYKCHSRQDDSEDNGHAPKDNSDNDGYIFNPADDDCEDKGHISTPFDDNMEGNGHVSDSLNHDLEGDGHISNNDSEDDGHISNPPEDESEADGHVSYPEEDSNDNSHISEDDAEDDHDGHITNPSVDADSDNDGDIAEHDLGHISSSPEDDSDDDGHISEHEPEDDAHPSEDDLEDNGHVINSSEDDSDQESDDPNLESGDNDPDSLGEGSDIISGVPSYLTQPLYAGAPLSCEASMYLTYQYAIKAKLSYQMTSHLINLIRVHCPAENTFPSSLHKLKKHFSFKTVPSTKQYCSGCLDEILLPAKRCQKRRCKHCDTCYFCVLPFEEHISEMYSEKWEELQYPFTRTTIPGVVQDIQDGQGYKELMQPDGFLSIPTNTGLIMCSDGVQLFKSCGQTLWPILLAVTSLPPGIRMNCENIILAGVWQGPVKPPMHKILTPVLNKLKHLKEHGVTVETPSGTKNIKACLLVGVFDLPAKAMATNHTQFNGNYGCNYCLDKGEHVSNRHIYKPSAPHRARSMRQITQCAQKAEEIGQSVFGVKGRSALSDHINIFKDVPVDYMHAVLEGVSKRLIQCWLDTKNKKCRFYLGLSTQLLDKRLFRIKPPQEFRRSPRSITTYKYWKASEYRAWLLYYSMPVVNGILPPDYVYHLSLIVSAMHILLGDYVQVRDIDTAESLLRSFCINLPNLYPEEVLTYNFHSLLHLCQCVRQWGPLWCYSCFGFENMNGQLRRNIHGTRNVLPQLIHTVRMQQRQHSTIKKLHITENAKTTAFLDAIQSRSTGTIVSTETEVKGRIIQKRTNEVATNALVSAGLCQPSTTALPTCYKVRHRSILYTAKPEGARQTCRNGSICIYKDATGLHFGTIRLFCFTGSDISAVVDRFENSKRCFFDGQRLRSLRESTAIEAKLVNEFIFTVKKLSLSKKTVAIPISSILAKCIHIP